jgi:nucleoside phosphorylase
LNILILAVLAKELNPIRAHLLSLSPSFKPIDLSFLKISVGLRKNTDYLKSYLGEKQIDLVINAGSAGTLSPELAMNEVVFPELYLARDAVPLTAELLLGKWSAIQTKLPVDFRRGTLYTSTVPVKSIEHRNEIYARTNALGVDMEAYRIAELCLELQIPFTALKVITDTADNQTSVSFNRNLDDAVNNLKLRLQTLIEIVHKEIK